MSTGLSLLNTLEDVGSLDLCENGDLRGDDRLRN